MMYPCLSVGIDDYASAAEDDDDDDNDEMNGEIDDNNGHNRSRGDCSLMVAVVAVMVTLKLPMMVAVP